MTTSVAKYDRLEDFEEHVVDYLASVTDLKVFGCTVEFLHQHAHLCRGPNMGETQKNTEFTTVFHDCSEVLHSKEIFEGCPHRDIPQAVQVSMNLDGTVPDSAFTAVPRLRRVNAEAGIRAI